MKLQNIKSILEFYNLGKLIAFKKLKRFGEVQDVFIIKTKKGKFFLKKYNKLTQNVIDGFFVVNYLSKRKYPCVRVIYPKNNKPYVEIT